MGVEFNPKDVNALLSEEEKKRLQEAALQQQKDNNAVAEAAGVDAAADVIKDNLPEGITSPHRQPENASVDISSSANPDDATINASTAETRLENGALSENKGPAETNTAEMDDVAQAKAKSDEANNAYLQAIEEANASNNKSFAEMVNDYYERMKTEEAQMQAEEKADRLATMTTGATELAANIINMLGVGELHASNQQYHSYSQDWMKKADENIKEHRNRRANMQDVLQRLKRQQEELRTSSKIEEAKLKAQIAQAAYNDALAAKKAEDDAEEKAWKRGVTERELDIREQGQKDSKAINWAKLNADEKQLTATMLAAGFVPDDKAPGGFRFDAEQATKIKDAKSSTRTSSSGSDSRDAFPVIDKDGKVNVARLRPHEVEYLMSNARNAITKDLGAEEAAEFDKEYKRAGDDKARSSVIMKWMGKSPTCDEIIKQMDNNYKAETGYAQDFGGNDEQEEKPERAIDELRQQQTGLAGYR